MSRITLNLRICTLAALLSLLDAVSRRFRHHAIGKWAATRGDRTWSRFVRARNARIPVRPALGQITRF